ncbi:MAG: hypothetical protein ACOYNZ_04975 [Rhodoferax sp.]
MSNFKNATVIAATAIAYFLLFQINSFLFSRLGYSEGVDWIYLPSGLRLVFVLIFVETGAIGIAIASSAIGLMYCCNGDAVTAVGAGAISGFAPWLARQTSLNLFELDVNLNRLTSSTLIKVAVLFSVFSPVMHQVWFSWRGQTQNFIGSTAVMVIGDLAGTALVLYAAKLLLLAHRQARTE